jgi:hypothetical protein
VEQLEDALLLPTLPFSASEMRSAPCEDEGDLLGSATMVIATMVIATMVIARNERR